MNVKSYPVLRDIKPPKEMIYLEWWFIVLSILIFSIVVLFVFYRNKSRLTKKSGIADCTATEQRDFFNELKDAKDIQDEKEYYRVISYLLRRHIKDKYQINALESPTTMIIDDMAKAGASNDEFKIVQSVLNTADMAKFAGAAFGKKERDRVYEDVGLIMK
ncbi:MAG: hypothetical protein HZA05_06035 [Nitrospirae bacterium]|nr:hypothetical protein [Nitrospirota bacterium]